MYRSQMLASNFGGDTENVEISVYEAFEAEDGGWNATAARPTLWDGAILKRGFDKEAAESGALHFAESQFQYLGYEFVDAEMNETGLPAYAFVPVDKRDDTYFRFDATARTSDGSEYPFWLALSETKMSFDDIWYCRVFCSIETRFPFTAPAQRRNDAMSRALEHAALLLRESDERTLLVDANGHTIAFPTSIE